jgi:hypothetical protein
VTPPLGSAGAVNDLEAQMGLSEEEATSPAPKLDEKDIEIEDALDAELRAEGAQHDEAAEDGPPPTPKSGRVQSQGVCHVCGRNPVWSPDRQRWYCEYCKRFL